MITAVTDNESDQTLFDEEIKYAPDELQEYDREDSSDSDSLETQLKQQQYVKQLDGDFTFQKGDKTQPQIDMESKAYSIEEVRAFLESEIGE